jgi:hypothetical protein
VPCLYTDAVFDAPKAVARALDGFDGSWFVAGGWAIDLFVGRETRAHKDIEIAILRRDQLRLQRHLPGWSFQAVLPSTSGQSRPWLKDEWLETPIHEINASSTEGSVLEILLNESDANDWIFRRDRRIRRTLASMGARPVQGIPCLAPDIVLLYKAAAPGPADEADFSAALPWLLPRQRLWLAEALDQSYPDCSWRQRLRA